MFSISRFVGYLEEQAVVTYVSKNFKYTKKILTKEEIANIINI